MTITPFEAAHLLALLPEILLVVLAGLVMGLDLVWPESRRRSLGLVAAIGLFLIAGVTLIFGRPGETQLIFGGMIRDDFAAFIFRIVFLFAGAITCLLSLDVEGVGRKGEYYTILIASVLGMNLMGAAADLIMLYLAIETTSITLYLLAGYLREDDRSAESGLKYFLFGALTSTVMLYGLSLLYGFTGQTGYYAIAEKLASGAVPSLPIIIALILIAVGFGFKVAAVPFHFWTPDVYEGAPTPITAFISVASKTAGFAVLMRFFLAIFPPAVTPSWNAMIMAMAAVTMTLGNALAIPQKNIKRLLAYSSIAHAGYVLVGFVAFSQRGAAAAIFYLITYVLTNLAAFTVVIVFAKAAGSEQIYDYAGLSRRSPGLALALLVAFLSLGGMPPLAGFFAKFYVFAAAVQSDLIWLAVVGVLNAIVGLYYYLVVLKVVYVYRSENDDKPIAVPRPYSFVLGLMVVGILVLGTASAPWFTWAMSAAKNLF
ncbi:MAG: NADH-quinone oxidoreductase subunit N [Chloroflexi bacterium]|nr:NADH-quinone oxidoreductase subunit N [Chloroflexota bacterium]